MNNDPKQRRKYVWPRYLLAAVVLGIIIAVLAIMKEAARIRDIQRVDPLSGQTNVEEGR